MPTTNQRAAATTKGGVDLDALESFVEYAAEHPEEVLSEWSATAFGQKMPGQTLAKVGAFTAGGQKIDRENREYTLSLGVPEEVGAALGFLGATDRMKSTEAALAALAGCITGTITLGAIAAGIELDDARATVTVPYDPRVPLGVYGVDAADTIYGDLRIDIDLEGEALGEEEFQRIGEMVRQSPVYNLVTRPNGCEMNVGSQENGGA